MDRTARSEEEGRQEVSVLVLGREGCGKTSLVLSLQALRGGEYPKRFDGKQKSKDEVHTPLSDGGKKYLVPPKNEGELPLMLTDPESCGVKDQVRLPGGRRLPIALRSGSLSYDAVLFVVDSTETPLFEDLSYCEEMAQLCATLRSQGYGVVIAIAKLPQAREEAVRAANHGAEHGGRVGRDPRRSYEEFVSRYIEKTCVALQATPALKAWHDKQDAGTPQFPHPRYTILDVNAWVSRRDFEVWQDRRGTAELPNLRYMQKQFENLVSALTVKPRVPSETPWYTLTDDSRT